MSALTSLPWSIASSRSNPRRAHPITARPQRSPGPPCYSTLLRVASYLGSCPTYIFNLKARVPAATTTKHITMGTVNHDLTIMVWTSGTVARAAEEPTAAQATSTRIIVDTGKRPASQ